MKSSQKITLSALFIALGIVIPMFMPKIRLEPASFTLASHVPVFLGMMISPSVGIAVALGTTAGFFISTSPVIALRAASHIVFVVVGALYLQKNPSTLETRPRLFSLIIGIIHGLCELLVVTIFYFGGGMGGAFYEAGFVRAVLLLVGLGTLIHSLVDFEISMLIRRALSKQRLFAQP